MKPQRYLILTILLCITIYLCLGSVAYAETVDSGTCGDNLTWTLDSNGQLSILGTGDMSNFGYSDTDAWRLRKDAIKSVVIQKGVTNIGDHAFYDCGSLVSVSIPDSVTDIGESSFAECSRLADVIIPGSVTNIGFWAFRDCRNLINVTILDGVTSIGGAAFSECSSLESIFIPKSVASIDYAAFDGCDSLIKILVDVNNTAYVDKDGILFSRDGATLCRFPAGKGDIAYAIPESVTSIEGHAFTYCSNLISVTIPNSVTYIGNYAFSDCSSMTSVNIPLSLIEISEGAFSGCSSLANITIPGNISQIGIYAFGKSGLTSVSIPGRVTSIGAEAFYNCNYLEDVIVADGVTDIDSWAFYNCDNLSNITVPESIAKIGGSAFEGCSNLSDVYYGGTQAHWYALCENGLGIGNDPLTNTTIHFNRFDISIDNRITNGIITASVNDEDVTTASANAVVTLAVIPAAGFELAENGLRVTSINGNNETQAVTVTQGTDENTDKYTFTMPAYPVNVTASFVTAWAALNTKLAVGGEIVLNRDYTATTNDTCLTVPTGKTVILDLNGHTLDRAMTETQAKGNVITVNGNLILTDSSNPSTGFITGGRIPDYGGGVYVNGGTFTLISGCIVGNSVTGTYGTYGGGGVYVSGGTFNMKGGKITDNSTPYGSAHGGGVHVSNGIFTMSGGEISGNTANGGGGVYVFGDSFTMSGGSIIGNSAAQYGGGVCCNGTFNLAGGEIGENTVGSGNNVVANNVYLRAGKVINVTGTLNNTEPIGVTTQTMPTATDPVVVTNGQSGKNTATHFASDNDNYVATSTATGECMLAVPLKVILPAENTYGTVHIASISDMPITGATPDYVLHNDLITLTVTPAEGFMLVDRELHVTCVYADGQTQNVEITHEMNDGKDIWSFVMPESDVTVTAEFVRSFGTPDFILPGFIKTIEESAFEGVAMRTVYIPDGCTSIGASAFRNCENLIQIRIPASVSSIDTSAFAECGTVYIFAPANSEAESFCTTHDNCVFVAD